MKINLYGISSGHNGHLIYLIMLRYSTARHCNEQLVKIWHKKDGENMKYKIAICDDSDADRQYVLNMVNHWAASVGHVVYIDTFTSAENFLFHYAEKSD